MRKDVEAIELVLLDGEVEVHTSAKEAWEHFLAIKEEVLEIWWVVPSGRNEGETLVSAETLKVWAEREDQD